MNDYDGDPLDDPDWEYDLEDDGQRYYEPSDETSQLAREIAENYGIRDWSEVIVNLPDVPGMELRGVRFGSVEEAVVFLFDIGVLEFGGVVYYPEEDLYGVAIDSETGRPVG